MMIPGRSRLQAAAAQGPTSHWAGLLWVVRATAVAQEVLRRGCTASRMCSNAHGNCGGRPRAGIGKFSTAGKELMKHTRKTI